jgi:hypothetical protein
MSGNDESADKQEKRRNSGPDGLLAGARSVRPHRDARAAARD